MSVGSSRSRSWILLAVVLGIIAAAGYFYYYGFPSLPIASIVGDNSVSGSSTVTITVTTTVTHTPSLFDYVNVGGGNVVDGVNFVDSVKRSLKGLFTWLLGESLLDAIFNLAIVLIGLVVVYVAMKFVKYIAMIIVFVGALVIVLRYVFGVI